MDRFHHVHFFDEVAGAAATSRRWRSERKSPRSPTASNSPLDPESAALIAAVFQRAGIARDAYRSTALMRRLRVCLRHLQAASPAEAWARLEQRPADLPVALNAFLLGVTKFFRDPAVFRYVNEQLLPQWRAEPRERRVWSAGCAHGAELYTMAMLLDRHGLLEQSWLWGSDCRADALERARRGWFDSPWELEDLPDGLREDYLLRVGRGWSVPERLRQAAHWGREDLLRAPPAEEPGWDMILCRNVAIYLEPEAATSLWTRLVSRLRTGGILITGKAERPLEPQSLARLAPSVFQKLSGGSP